MALEGKPLKNKILIKKIKLTSMNKDKIPIISTIKGLYIDIMVVIIAKIAKIIMKLTFLFYF